MSLPASERRVSQRHVEAVTVRRAKDGGYEVEQQYVQGPGPVVPATTTAFKADEGDAVASHVRKVIG